MGNVNSVCGRPCFIVGGPFIAEDPTCPVHGVTRQMFDQRSECDLLMEVLSRLPIGCEVHIGVEEGDDGDSNFLGATVQMGDEEGELPYGGLLFGVSVEDGNFMKLAKLLREAIVADKRIVLRESENE